MSGKRMSVQEVMSVVDRDSLFYANSDGGVTFGGGEPTAAATSSWNCSNTVRVKGITFVWIPAGCAHPNSFGKC